MTKTTDDVAVSIRGLQKNYGATSVVSDVDLDIHRGEIFGLLGPNGAGKTTMVEILEGFRMASAGTVSVLGTDPAKPTARWKARIGVVLQQTGSFEMQTVAETIDWYRTVFPNSHELKDVLTLVDLLPQRDQRVEKLSGGQKRRVDIACGITGRPELLFLDEPTTGLDPQARRGVWDLIAKLRDEGTTIVLTSHYLDEVEHLADRIGVLVGGRLVSVGPLETFGGRDTSQTIVGLTLPANMTPPELVGLRQDGANISVDTSTPTAVVLALHKWADSNGLAEIPGLSVNRPSLEDLYLKLLGKHSTPDDEVAR